MYGSTLNRCKNKFVHPRSNIPHNYQRRRYSAHKQYSTQLPMQTVQRTQAIIHAITNAGGTAHTSNIPRNYQRRRYSAHKQYSTQLPTQTVQRTQAIFHAITNADSTAHTSNIPRNYQRRRYSAHKPLRDSQHLLFCISYMLQFYSTANITKQIPDRFLSTQCETKDKKKTLSSQTVGVGYGLIALLQRCERKLCRIKIGTFQRSEKVVGTPEYYRLKEEQSRGKRAEWELCSQE